MSENGIIHQEKKFEFPDVIIELWKLWTEYGKTGRDNPRFYEIFDCLKKYLSSKICLHKKYSSRENWEQEKEEKEEIIENFLFSILYSEEKGKPRTNPCPKYQECEEKYIVKNLRKFVTKKRNPTEYELRNILRGTLHSMKKNMEVSVIPADEKYYNNETIFCLPGCESNALGTAESYDSSCIDTYFIEPYNIDERKKEKLMLQPAKARKLILQILHAFHGNGKFKEIVKCAKDHISNSGSYPLWGVIPGSKGNQREAESLFSCAKEALGGKEKEILGFINMTVYAQAYHCAGKEEDRSKAMEILDGGREQYVNFKSFPYWREYLQEPREKEFPALMYWY